MERDDDETSQGIESEDGMSIGYCFGLCTKSDNTFSASDYGTFMCFKCLTHPNSSV